MTPSRCAKPPLLVLPIEATSEWVMWESRGRKASVKDLVRFESAWRSEPTFQSELDGALRRWFGEPVRKHGMWFGDLNLLAYGLIRAKRFADAKQVFEAIGPFMTDLPWAWLETTEPKKDFPELRRRALRQ